MEDFTRQQIPVDVGQEVHIKNHQPTAIRVLLGFASGSRITVSLPPTGVVTFVSQGDITSIDVDVPANEGIGPRRIE